MLKSRKRILGLVVGMLALALITAITVISLGQSSTATAAPAAQATATPALPNFQAKAAEFNQYLKSFRKSLATHLNVTEDQLEAAVAGAVSDTTGQLVKDGHLTQSQADQINAIAKQGLNGLTFPPNQATLDQFKGLLPFGQDQVKQVESDLAAVLKLQPSDLEAKILAGQSLAEIAKAQGVDVQAVKDTLLKSGKAQLDAAVKAGKLTQAQADQVYQYAPMLVDKLVTMKADGKFPHP